FANFYAPSPRCTPSRATYFTGKNPALLRMTFVSAWTPNNPRLSTPAPVLEMPAKETTIAELLKAQGYATAHFGKWHVGRRLTPRDHGFDESDGPTNNGGPDNVAHPNPAQAYGIAERGMDFIERHAKAGEPFFVQMSQYGGRDFEDALPATVAKVQGWGLEGREAGAAAVALDVDITVGRILDKLEQLGIAGNTYVVYTTDHGTPGRENGPLAKGKGTVWEGGLRVPLLVSGPGIEPGSVSHVRVWGADLFPTIAELAGVERALPGQLEGGSLARLLRSGGEGKVERLREEMVFHVPHYDSDPLGPASAIILDSYKLIRFYELDKPKLFDLSQDRGERQDLADKLPEKTAELDRRLAAYLEEVHAELPQANINFDPSKQSGERPPGRRDRRRPNQPRPRQSP
ncbi:MAG: sulfatase-like hydrolase/transferase, partial [Acidobacteria bacterium]|nr:sulfatase-like hydrolase/transferase [Acidobacteriota bacterium]